jgi:glycosyltransferase involved in cell wall biosynthesis
LIEAMALGLPAVATSVGAVPEMIRPAQDGFIVAPRDPEAIAGRTAEILRDPELCASMSKNARHAAVECFRTEICAEAHLRAYTTGLAHARRRYGTSLHSKNYGGSPTVES